MLSKAAIWMVIILVLFVVFKTFETRRAVVEPQTYTQMMDDAKNGRIKRVEVQGRNLNVTPVDGKPYTIVFTIIILIEPINHNTVETDNGSYFVGH